MKTPKCFGVLTVAALLICSVIAVEGVVNIQNVGAGARSAALGNSFVAVADDGDAVFANPAGLSQLQGKQLAYTNVSLFYSGIEGDNLGQHVGAFAQPIKDDHLQFMRVGVPSCDLIDLEYGPRNSYWHTPADTLENCSLASLAAIGRIVLLGLPKLEAWALNRP